MNFEVDFSTVKSKSDIILKLADTFKLHDISGSSWDSFEDYFTNLNSDSEIIRTAVPVPTSVHLLIKNIAFVKKVSEKDYEILLSVLTSASQIASRGDSIQFTFELQDL